MPTKPTTTSKAKAKSTEETAKGTKTTDGSKEKKDSGGGGGGVADDEEGEVVMHPDLVKLRKLQQELVTVNGVISSTAIADAAQKEADRKRADLRLRHKDAAKKQQNRRELQERSGANVYHPELNRIIAQRKGKSTFETDPDVLANLALYARDPALFSPTGEDTDQVDFPGFPFASDNPKQPGAPQATASYSADNVGELTEEEKLHRKFERRLLVRQLQRNRQIVDEQDSPSGDWALWRAAANNALKAVPSATNEEIVEQMNFAWRTSAETRNVKDLPCYASQKLLQEAQIQAHEKLEAALKQQQEQQELEITFRTMRNN